MAKNGFSMSNRVAVEEVTAAKTLTANDCGKLFTVDAAGAFTITLPDPGEAGAGWNCTILCSDAPGGNVTITAGSTILHAVGYGADVTDTSNYPASAGTAQLKIVLSTNCDEGDLVDLVTDGTLWYARIITHAQNGATVATS